MQMITSVVLGLLALSAGAGSAAAAEPNATAPSAVAAWKNAKATPYGVMTPVAIGPSHVEDLMVALGNRTHYAEKVGRPICIVEVKKVSMQLANGINYQFQVQGCSQTFTDRLGLCDEGGCKEPALWAVDAFVQASSGTFRVDRIQFLE